MISESLFKTFSQELSKSSADLYLFKVIMWNLCKVDSKGNRTTSTTLLLTLNRFSNLF